MSSAEVGDVLIIDDGVGCRGDGDGAEGGRGAQEGTTVALGVEGGLGRGLCVWCERGGGTVRGERRGEAWWWLGGKKERKMDRNSETRRAVCSKIAEHALNEAKFATPSSLPTAALSPS